MKKYLSVFILLTLLIFLVAPLTTNAAGGDLTTPPQPNAFCMSCILAQVFNPIWQLAAGLAVIMFVVSGILFITSSGEPGKITSAKNSAIWGVVGIVVAIIGFSIVQIVSGWV